MANNIVKDTAALIPDVVREAFVSTKSLSVRDVLLLEAAGVTFFATGGNPTFKEMTTVFWLITDRDSFRAAVDSGEFRVSFDKWADTVSPAVITKSLLSIAGILKQTFQPMEDDSKKPRKGTAPNL
ncbi:MAG: hypothetical protein KHX31_06680 [Akkermansia sp.]|uniref:hypothetical protein n=1 Tax=Akkermansia sp. TaxID=1872421 RepID=UPI0025BE39BD|nr:hypothetical protein [Akkermansia sp.]MBS5508303.1 hypothetical protein [Akkermansia sp.]